MDLRGVGSQVKQKFMKMRYTHIFLHAVDQAVSVVERVLNAEDIARSVFSQADFITESVAENRAS